MRELDDIRIVVGLVSLAKEKGFIGPIDAKAYDRSVLCRGLLMANVSGRYLYRSRLTIPEAEYGKPCRRRACAQTRSENLTRYGYSISFDRAGSTSLYPTESADERSAGDCF